MQEGVGATRREPAAESLSILQESILGHTAPRPTRASVRGERVMIVWCEDHKRSDCSHALSELGDELASEVERLNRHLVQIHAALAEHAGTETEIRRLRAALEQAMQGEPA
jgi:hypothetical protein